MITSREQYEERWDDYFASSDSVRERYASELADIKADNMQQQWYDEYMTKVWNAGYGTDDNAYEDAWKRAFDYANSGAIDDILGK